MIPEKAVEAAMEAYYANGEEPFEAPMRAALEAAAPHIRAQAWEEGRLVGRAEEQSGFDTEMNPYGDPYMLNNEGEK